MKAAAVPSVLCLVLLPTMAVEYDVRASDGLARNAIFAEQHVENSAFDIHLRALLLPLDQRHDFLSRWVLPGTAHDSLRVQIGFSPTDPAPVVAEQLGETIPKSGRRQSTGGRMVSPVADLIDAAAKLDNLDALRSRVASWKADVDDEHRDHAAVLALIELRRGDHHAAVQRVEQLLQFRATSTVATTASKANDRSAPPSAGELLILQRGFEVRELREPITELLAQLRPWVISDFDRPVPHRHVAGFLTRLLLEQETKAPDEEPLVLASQRPMTQWHSASRSTAQTRGDGQPPADWFWRPGFVANIDSHDDDYLIFKTPLRGNYEVECDVTGFEWRDSSLLVAGNWLAPVYTHRHFDIGSFRGPRPRIAFNPPLTRTRTWLHYRTVVRDGTATTYFQGRPIHSEPLPEDPGPWVAIRSTSRHDGAVHNLRITGSPEIPDELQLSAVDALNDWIPCFEGIEAGLNAPLWYVAPRGGADNEITGLGTQAGEIITPVEGQFIAGTQESLLRYFRPMDEDGTIEYEFYYVPGQLQAHPALDRLAFLLLPDGVRIHWITDGPLDRTGLAADNVSEEPTHRRGPATLPLKTNDWNRLQLSLKGDTVALALNGEAIYERPLEVSNQRTFGLFHFADWSTLLARRVVWRGDWPRELPPLAEQELAIPEAEFLADDFDRLAATFEHDFTRDGLPINRFTIMRGTTTAHLQATPGGLLATRDATVGNQATTIAPSLALIGDFDATVEYHRFATRTAPTGNSLIALQAILDNDVRDESLLARRYYSRSADRIEQLVHCIAIQHLPEDSRRNYLVAEPMEETSGRLRIARRGNQLYYLTSEGDSPHFRLRGQRDVPEDAVETLGLRLLTQISGDEGQVAVLWKHLSIRAEELQGHAVSGFDQVVADLNAQREKLPARLTHDFRTQEPTVEKFDPWGTVAPWQASPDGWLISATGSDNWTSSGVSVQSQLEGDFDVTVRFNPEALAVPTTGQHSQVYLQMEASDEDRTTIGAIFTLEPDGSTAALAQVRERNAQGEFSYRVLGQVAVGQANALRIARRGSSITFLAASSLATDDQVIADYELSDVPIEAGNLRLLLHTGGTGRVSQMHWQSLDIRAAEIDDAIAGDAQLNPSANGVADSISDPSGE